MKLLVATVGVVLGFASWVSAEGEGAVVWTRNGAPTEAQIAKGPWTLEQSGAAVGLKSAGYCDSSGAQVGNDEIERMQPYYFPFIVGQGKHLQGYFDWRPKDIDEGVVAAISEDAGFTWTFQQKVLELRKTCPSSPNTDPDGDKDFTSPDNSDNVDDDGQGHQFVMHVAGHTYLYTLIRASGYIDSADLVIHDLTPEPGHPLVGAPENTDAPTDDSAPGTPEPEFHTHGLLNPDGILGVVPGSSPLTIIYEQKILSGDLKFPESQRCATYWSAFYAQNGKLTPNDDVTYLRLASTEDGINFTDLGTLDGLHDPTTVSLTGTRWLATAGTILKLANGRYGLFYSGGNCIDADSDAFHYIGYAESMDLKHWKVVYGLNGPIASVSRATVPVDENGIPTSGGVPVTIPANTPVVGTTMGFFAGRVYAASATKYDSHDITVVFAGYHTQKPKNGLGDYRTIGRVSLHSRVPLESVGASGE